MATNCSDRLGRAIVLDGGQIEREIRRSNRREVGAVNRSASEDAFSGHFSFRQFSEGR